MQRNPQTARFRRRAALSPRDLALVCVAAVLVLVAVSFYACSGRTGPLTVSPEAPNQAFVCAACGERFELTAQEVQDAAREIGPSTARAPAEKGYPCPKCGEWAGQRAD